MTASERAAGLLLGASASVAAWVLAGYPLVLAALPARPWRQGDEPLRVSLLVPAYREREALRHKLEAPTRTRVWSTWRARPGRMPWCSSPPSAAARPQASTGGSTEPPAIWC
jgi:hypothetical protein